ncbi:uncharacterized protein MYCFIDRAFT_80562 [Pseudocercospora fijiensis CIRAD86]|uniref:N-acetyltransferase domain-containing protein n=1 Tax=Pseudocercospora fijiensis (strain CIRAD86) TaxID=383855 RepID=M2ZVF9_PSEFD|nr:uncharacterized protein MYCFIDRAFT_80562 [Pseudocercospora fijiensis CIRAD86]EME82989.1 hypothetical protein MYCFIDRAFT_80562 [Pseudocercospora fijiensis CIRAD86]
MAASLYQQPTVVVVAGSSLPSQPWWKALHLTINTSFQNKDFAAFPPTWSRLPTNSKLAAEKLAEELGPRGLVAVVLLVDRPIACAGALPFRGDNWIDDVESADQVPAEIQHGENGTTQGETVLGAFETVPNQKALPNPSQHDWELCCVCVHPLHRKIGLSVKILDAISNAIRPLGARRLMSNYVIEETGMYWPHLGFETIPGAGGVLKKGFTHTKGMPGLKADIHFAMGCKNI